MLSTESVEHLALEIVQRPCDGVIQQTSRPYRRPYLRVDVFSHMEVFVYTKTYKYTKVVQRCPYFAYMSKQVSSRVEGIITLDTSL